MVHMVPGRETAPGRQWTLLQAAWFQAVLIPMFILWQPRQAWSSDRIMALSLSIWMEMAALILFQGCAPLIVGGAATGASVIHDRRSAGVALDDQTIELKVLAAVDEDLAAHSKLSATSYNRVVLLTGQAENAVYAKRFVDIASGIWTVNRIVNEIEIGPSVSLTQQTKDSWITSKVKLGLLDIDLESFDASRVKVVTENGIVYLMGLVTHAEAAASVEKARWIKGVTKVVKVFEYI